MTVTYSTSQTDLEALALDSHVPSPDRTVIQATCVGAVTTNRFVELADDGTTAGIQLPATAGNRTFGVALATGAIGDSVPVCVFGLCEVELGATLTAPDEVSAATTGKAIAATSGHIVGGQLLADGADTNLRRVMVLGSGSYAAA